MKFVPVEVSSGHASDAGLLRPGLQRIEVAQALASSIGSERKPGSSSAPE